MIRHLIKLVWSRKRANALLVLEIFVSFIVLFAVTATFLVFLSRVQRPMGFSYDALYTAAIDHRDFDLGEAADLQGRRDLTARLLDELETLPGAEAVAAASFSPFELAYSTSELEHEGASVSADRSSLTDGGLETLGLEIVRGRWFEKADDALDWTPVVINQVAVDRLFKGQDPIGKTVNEDNDWRVVGVIRAYRKNGALSGINPSVILRVSLDRASEVAPPQRFLIRVSPGTGGEIEERVLDLMRALAPEWTFQIEPTDSIRRRNGRMAATPLVLGAMVAGFLLVMVFLGMVGVFWQSVTQRIGEIGLRRAMGARRSSVHQQILGEILVVTVVGALAATVLIVQLPLLGVLSSLGWGTVGMALLVSFVLMALLATTSGLYPAWLAARVEPAQALHDE